MTYQNLALLLGVFLLSMTVRAGILKHRFLRRIAIVCILLSAYGLTIKRSHIRAGRTNRGDESALLLPSAKQHQALINLPSQYSVPDYTTAGLFVPLTEEESKIAVAATIGFDSGKNFGEAQPLPVSFSEPSWVRTNILAFPWNRFTLDGRDVPETDVRIYNSSGIALHVPAGNHQLEFKFAPDRLWGVLRVISQLALFAWLLSEIVSSLTANFEIAVRYR